MNKYTRLIGHYNGESQNFEALAGGFQASGFTPPTKGRLKGIRILLGGEAATSLVEGVEFRLSCPLWSPNNIEVCAMGNGLRTVPATPQGTPIDYPVDLPVEPGNPITIEARHNVATAVTCQAFLIGFFES